MKFVIRLLLILTTRVIHALCYFLSFSVCSRLGYFIGYIAYFVTPVARKRAFDNIQKAFPEYSRKQVKNIALKSFINQGRNLLEFFKFPSLKIDTVNMLVDFPDKANLDEAFARGKGVMYFTAHFGNWELLGASMAFLGYPVNVIARKIYLEYWNTMMVSHRQKVGMKVILRSDESSARDILKALKKNELIGILIDQDTKVAGVFVDFFGRQAFTPSGFAAISLRSGAAVVGGFLIRSGNKHILRVTKPLELKHTGDKQKDVLINTQIFTKMLEDIIREYPEQWVWMHNRWKTKNGD